MDDLHLLQSLDLDARSEVEQLYFRAGDETSKQLARLDDTGLVVPAESTVSFDTYFNAFFEHYWFGFTHVGRVQLHVEVDGDCEITLWRQTPDLDIYRLGRQAVTGAGSADFEIAHDDELRAEAGRVWFEVEASGVTTVTAGRWTTTSPPVREVALGVVFCTFNREKYLHRILRAIDRHGAACERLGRIFVVNQGAPFTAQDIVGDGSEGRVLELLEVLAQPNLGGCGGFTRGMHETALDDSLTHFVLLDDDSRVHPDSLVRIGSFLSYAHDGVSVGGHMLNLHRPNYLFEAGAELNRQSLQPEPLHQGTDLGGRKGLEVLLRGGPVEYNGWWLFGADKQVLDDVGYPMPCFIRGDDIEFGMRLRRSGQLTVPVPGISVWHEPFYLKLGGWQFFFEVRNRLAAASLHNIDHWRGLRDDLRRVFTRDIAMSRYHSTQLMIEALKAYLAGPKTALTTDDAPLVAAREIVADLGPTRIDYVGHTEARHEAETNRGELRILLNTATEHAKRPLRKASLLANLMRRVAQPTTLRDEPTLTIRAADLKPHIVAGHDDYVVVEEHGSIGWRYRRNRDLERKQWREFRALLMQVTQDSRYRDAFESSRAFAADWEKTYADIDRRASAN